MIRVLRIPTAEEFRQKAGKWLAQKEAQNSLCLGVTSNLLSKPSSNRQEHHLWIVEKDGALEGSAFWTPPYKFTISDMGPQALEALADEVLAAFPRIPGVGGPQETADRFSRYWGSKTSYSPLLEMSMRIFQLEKVEPVPSSAGFMKSAQEADTGLLTEWYRGLKKDSGLEDPVDEKTVVEGTIREQRLFIWDDGGNRAMAGYGRETPNSLSVNMVYTPPEFRRKGYATSLASALSQKILDLGKKYCLLYTDISNPVSNGIYQKIGYRPVCDWNAYQFK
jgi:uncharacterized protein